MIFASFSILLIALPLAAQADPLEDLGLDDVDYAGHRPPDRIVNGKEENRFPQTVSLGAFGFSLCSGSLITPKIILSAGHCGADIPLDIVVSLGSAYFGPSITDPTDEVGFVSMVLHPDYVPLGSDGFTQSLPEFDLALLELENAVDVDPIWFNERRLRNKDIGKEVTSVGFGITSSAGAGSGEKRSAVLTVDGIDDMFVLSSTSTNDGGGQICSGDSGGPQYYKDPETGEWIQWSVHSWGDQNCLVESGSTRTDVAADFILDFVEKVHGTRDKCAVLQRYGDGVCDLDCEAIDRDCSLVELSDGDFASADAGSDPTEARGCRVVPGGSVGGWLLLVGLLGLRRRS